MPTDQEVTCGQAREDIPLLAIGALSEDDTARLERHIDVCNACRHEFEAHRGVFEMVRRESSPSVMLDSARILKEMKKRMQEESRVGYEPVAPVSPQGLKWWLGGLLAIALAAGLFALAVNLQPEERTDGAKKTAPPAKVALATARNEFGAGQAKDLYEGDACSAEDGTIVSYRHGVELRLRDKPGEATRVRLAARDRLTLAEGVLAVFVPPGHTGFHVEAGALRVQTSESKEPVRFVVELVPAQARLSVVSGKVRAGDGQGEPFEVAANQVAQLASGRLAQPTNQDTAESYLWIFGQMTEHLELVLQAGKAPAGGPWPAVFSVTNTGSEPLRVAGYHQLGINYQIEFRKAGQAESVFSKVAPRVVRKHSPDETPQPVQESTGWVTLQPGQAYELELNLRTLLTGPGEYVLTAHYLGFEQPLEQPAKAVDAWGLTLKSEPLKVTLEAPGP